MDKTDKMHKRLSFKFLFMILALLVIANLMVKSKIDSIKTKTINLNINLLRNIEKNYISKELKNSEIKFDYLYEKMRKKASDKGNAESVLKLWKESIILFEGISQIYLGLNDGRLIAFPEYSIENGYTTTNRPWYRNALKKNGKNYWLTYKDYQDKETFLSLNRKIELNNKTYGVFGIAIDNAQMRKNLSEIILDNEEGYIFLISSDKVIYHKKEYEDYSLYGNLYNEIKDNTLGYRRGEDFYIFYTDTYFKGWKLVKAVRNEVIERELHSYRRIVNTIFVLEMVIILYGFILLIKKIKESHEIDQLTSVFKREILQRDMNNLFKGNKSYGFIFIDIDDFKKINDTYGHHVGDEVLKKVGNTIKDFMRDKNKVYRYGGEEFVIYSIGDSKDIWNLGETIRQGVERLEWAQGLKVTISGGIGISNGESSEELLKKADKLLYRSKMLGKNRILI